MRKAITTVIKAGIAVVAIGLLLVCVQSINSGTVKEDTNQKEKIKEKLETDEGRKKTKEHETTTYIHENVKDIKSAVKRVDVSRKTDAGRIAIMYYEKPVIFGDTEAIRKINAYFEEDAKNWSLGRECRMADEGDYEYFLKQTTSYMEDYGELRILENPTRYTVDTSIILSGEKYISVLQMFFRINGGPSATEYYGSTFDLETGELLPIHAIIEADADTFRDMLVESIIEDGGGLDSGDIVDIVEYYGKNDKGDYLAEDYGEITDLSYAYAYDGDYFYLTLNEYVGSPSHGAIIKWNGLYGKEKETSWEMDAKILGMGRRIRRANEWWREEIWHENVTWDYIRKRESINNIWEYSASEIEEFVKRMYGKEN